MTLTLTRAWILISAYLVCAGWLLSAIHSLNRDGYTLIMLPGAILGGVVWRNNARPRAPFRFRRFRRLLPGFFLFLCALVILTGFLYPPSNYDALAYRIPRTLHWLAAGHWHWIRTAFQRLNTRSSDCEWIMAPLVLFAKTERWIWLMNAGMFCALPGLLFAAFTRAGVSKKVAWRWMWVLPTGYVYLLQAGGNSNDLVGTFYALAAVALALRASRQGDMHDLWLSMLAAGLSQGVKASNIPLGLPWLIAALPALRQAALRPARTMAVGLAALLVSAVPNAVFNFRHGGDWTGAQTEFGRRSNQPAWVLLSANAIRVVTVNFAPPIFPLASRWNAFAPRLAPQSYKDRLMDAFRDDGVEWGAFDMHIEDNAPLGLGVSLLLGFAATAAFFDRKEMARPAGWWESAVRWAPWVALLAFMAKAGLGDAGRLLASYYLLLPIAILAGRGQTAFIQSKTWRVLTGAQLASALLMLVVLPSRPLWPALTVLRRAEVAKPGSTLVERMLAVYGVYRQRPDALAPVREAIPPEAHLVGLVTADDLETSLWRPFGGRQFRHVLSGDSGDVLRREGIEFIVVSPGAFEMQMQEPLAAWLQQLNAEVIKSVTVSPRAAQGPVTWNIVRLRGSG
jgi:hypothetical protein